MSNKSRILEVSTSFREGIQTGLSCKTGVAKHQVICISTICIWLGNQLDRNFQSFFSAGFRDGLDLSASEQPLEDGSLSVSAFLLPKKLLRSLCLDILAAVFF